MLLVPSLVPRKAVIRTKQWKSALEMNEDTCLGITVAEVVGAPPISLSPFSCCVPWPASCCQSLQPFLPGGVAALPVQAAGPSSPPPVISAPSDEIILKCEQGRNH